MESQEGLEPFVISPAFLNGPMLLKLTGLALINTLAANNNCGVAHFYCGYMKKVKEQIDERSR